MKKDYEFYVSLEDEKVIGFFIASFSLLEGHLLNISVAPNMKRQGIGNELLKKAENISNKFGIKEIFLEVRESNQEAINFYKKNGFVEVGIRKNYYKLYEGREDALIFSKKLGFKRQLGTYLVQLGRQKGSKREPKREPRRSKKREEK